MKNKFKLEGLLKLRKLKENREKIALAKVGKSISNKKKDIYQIKSDIGEAHRYLETDLNDIRIFELCSSYIGAKKIDLESQENDLVKMNNDFREKMEELSKLKDQVEVVEKLKDKDMKKFRDKYLKKVQNEIDDILIARKKRKR